MADYLDRAHDTLRGVPDFVVLSDIADRLGMPFAIRGGVSRNLLARSVLGEETAVHSITDLVDPFSDVDLVVHDESIAPALLVQVHSRLAVAGFLRWELKVRNYVERCSQTEARTSLDGVEIVFRPKKLPPELANHEVAASSLMNRELLPILPSRWFSRWSRRESRFRRLDADIFALRAARFTAQFGLRFPVSILRELAPPHETEQERPLTPYAQAMLNLAALDVLFTAATFGAASSSLAQIEDRLLLDAARQSVSRVRDLADAGQAVYAVAYPAWEETAPATDAGVTGGDDEAVGEEPSLLPWVPVRLPPGGGECCRGDFSLGPLTITWRDSDGSAAEPEVELAPVILLPSADDYAPDRFVFAAPGIVDVRRSSMMRLDWGFAQLLAGAGRTVFVGARRTAQAEDGS